MTRLLRGRPLATEIERRMREEVERLADDGTTPRVATVLMSDDPADTTFMAKKRAAFADWGVESVEIDVDPSAPADTLYEAVERASDDSSVHGVFVQVPLPSHVDELRVREHIAPAKDVDCFHPENLGRLAYGDPRFVPVTSLAVLELLDAYDIPVAGADVVIVGRSPVIGRPLANLLLQKAPHGNATVTVCHSRTRELAAKTRRADVLVTAAGVPGLVDGSMIRDGATVIDVSANRDDDSEEASVVGDVDFEAAKERADAITPVPGGVGPLTMAMLFRNVVQATRERVT